MAIIKTLSGYTKLDGHMKDYLENGPKQSPHEGAQGYFERSKKEPDRLLAMDFVNIPYYQEKEWAKAMDETRKAHNNDKPWNKKQAVFYRQFIISPDPDDKISLDDLRELATSWAKLKFGRHGDIGTFQVAIAYHDDNENHIPHAHIVVNNTDLNSFKRMQIGGKEYNSLRVDLQTMCIARGMHHLDFQADDPEGAKGWVSKPASEPRVEVSAMRHDFKDHKKKLKQPTALVRERKPGESFYVDSGIRLWKDDLRDAIEGAADSSLGASEFFARLNALNIAYDLVKGDIMYHHPSDPENRKVLGKNLGEGFTLKGICEHQLAKLDSGTDRAQARAEFEAELRTETSRGKGMRVADKGRGNSHRELGNTIWKRSQDVYRTDSERRARKGGAKLWKDDLRNWARIAAQSSTTLAEWQARMRALGVDTEIKNGDIMYHHPTAPDSRKCYGGKLGRMFTPEGIMQQQFILSNLEDEIRIAPGVTARLVEATSFHVDSSLGISLQDAADALEGLRKSGAQSQAQLEAELVKAKDVVEHQDEPQTRKEKRDADKNILYVHQLECAILHAEKLGAFDYDLSPAERAEKQRERALERLQPILAQKIRAGAKSLTNDEYKLLTPEQIEVWKHYRNQRRWMERAAATSDSSSSGSGDSQSQTRSATR